MLNLIIELSKDFLLILIVLYTFESFTVFKYEDVYKRQLLKYVWKQKMRIWQLL